MAVDEDYYMPPVFISCSFDEKDSDLIEFFTRVVRALRLNPVTAQNPEARPIPEKVTEAVSDSSAVLAILTRRGAPDTENKFNAPEWIQQEMGMAYAFGKPLAILVESGVSLGSLSRATEYVEFDRERLHESVPKVISLLLSLQSQITPTWGSPPYRLEKQEIHIVLRADGSYGLSGEFILQAVQDGIRAFDNFLNTPFGGTYTLEETEISISSPDKRVSCDVLASGKQRVAFEYRFDPPLKRGEKVEWEIKVDVPHPAIPMTRREIARLIEERQYPVERMVAIDGWLVVPPTSELEITWEFPPGYLPQEEDIIVQVGAFADGFVLEDELERLRDRKALGRVKLSKGTVLRLKVSRPLSGYLYGICWIPPGPKAGQ
jgi:hypothetical protein